MPDRPRGAPPPSRCSSPPLPPSPDPPLPVTPGSAKPRLAVAAPSSSYSTQLFVSRVELGLSCYSTNKELKELFAPFGEVKEARLVIDGRTRRPKGFGFVTYDSEIDAQRALKAMDGRDLDGTRTPSPINCIVSILYR
ncbi:hypothetical protein Scep_023724 [Stephania cephalantha]|uniref:RRM domain-containing protein n=1 Tax=Stephania cephalantha TaxID=152367 RepID=A0AAP0EVP7_9MAGN